ncbi:MAG: YfdX family protein [Nitratireductor sp.]|nr:YfdX family protein [Nitratireductor sp.]MCC0020353.1 YfdX family protein [Nitratireductor sp.]
MTTTIRKLAFAFLATTAIAGAGLMPANAASTTAPQTDQVAQASQSGEANPDLRLSQDGFGVMRDVRAARVAIFNGDTDAAKKYLDQAKQSLDKIKTDSALANKGLERNNNLIPIDGQVVVADNLVATPEKAQHIAAGNQKIKSGNGKEAMEELKLANVDVGFTRLLMPYTETVDHVTVAENLLNHDNYYEANMALKAAEDGLQVESVMLVEPSKDMTNTGSVTKTPAAPQKSDTQMPAK